MLLPIHVATGGLAIVLGAVALTARKGGPIHRRAGMAFVLAMAIMGISASILEALKGPADRSPGNVVAAFLTLYFVGTAVSTVRPPSPWTSRINAAALPVAIALGGLGLIAGVRAFNSPRGVLDGVPFFMHFFLATILLLAAAGDIRQMRNGALRGAPRLRRHLWRMCFALFIAAGSFFSIREWVAAVLPDPFTAAPMRILPILLIFGSMFYWLWRLRARRPSLAT